MDFIAQNIVDYAEQHSTLETDVLRDLNRETHAKILMPRMLSGHLQGKLLEMVSRMIRPGWRTLLSIFCLKKQRPAIPTRY